MSSETGFHKLGNISDWSEIEKGSFVPSMPAEKHWLGEGAYFFLNPNGLSWAIKWPFKGHSRANKADGIVIAQIDTSNGLDFRDAEVMTAVRGIINSVRNAIQKKRKHYSDGLALATVFKSKLLPTPSCVIANFDPDLSDEILTYNSRFILKPCHNLPPYSETTQIQACVIDQSIITEKYLYSEFTAV